VPKTPKLMPKEIYLYSKVSENEKKLLFNNLSDAIKEVA
jgi:hypothetical protein